MDELFGFVGRTGLDPELVAGDEVVAGGGGRRVVESFVQAAAVIVGPVGWGRISLRYLAGQRVHAVLHGVDRWDEHHDWPPPHEPADLPDEIATLTELVTLATGGGIELSDPPGFDTDTWAHNLLSVAGLEPFQTLHDVSNDFAVVYNETEARLARASARLETWLTGGTATEADPDLWGYLDDHGGLAGVIEHPEVLLERPALHAQLRGAVRTLLDHHAVTGLPELRVAHALRFITRGQATYHAALAAPHLGHIPYLADLTTLHHLDTHTIN